MCGSSFSFKPKRGYHSHWVLIILHFLAAIILITAAILGYAGTSILSYKTNKNESQTNIHYLNDIILDTILKSNNILMNIYESDFHKSLINITNQYNSAFSDINSIYRTSFNNIYFDTNTSKNLKVSLRKMDISRDNTLSKIISFTGRFLDFSKSIQNILNKNYFVPVEKSNKEIKIGLKYSIGNISVIDNMFVAVFSYILASIIILFAVLYSLCFFYNNRCSKCCFFVYPLFALLISASTLLTCFFITNDNYKPWNNACNPKYYPNNTISNLFKNFSNISIKDSFELDSYNEVFNEKDTNELIQKINSR